MSEIKEKVEAELKTVKALCETMEQAIKTQVDRGLDKVSTHELYEAVDILKDLTEAKKNIVETCYKMQIMEAMEKSEYGEEYDEEGPKFYNMNRYANGRYAPKGRGMRRGYQKYPVEEYRDMDLSDGRMYYSDGYSDGEREGNKKGYEDGNRDGYSRGYSEGQRSGGGNRDYREGRSGQSRRTYVESKEMGKDKQEKMKKLEDYTNELSNDLMEMLKDASPEEKSLVKNKMQNIVTKMN
jgi:hypothetical protein